MTRKDMLLKFKELQDRNMKTVRDKNKTYGAYGDAFQAFKDAVSYGSKIETQPQALWNMMSKHLVTVKRWIDEGTVPNEEEAAEKLGDIAIYMGLLELMWSEQPKGTDLWYLKDHSEHEDDLGVIEPSYASYARIPDISKDGEKPVSCGECRHVYARGGRCDIAGRAVPYERGLNGICGYNGAKFQAKGTNEDDLGEQTGYRVRSIDAVSYVFDFNADYPDCGECDNVQDGDICGLTGEATVHNRVDGSCGPKGRMFKQITPHICDGCAYLRGTECASRGGKCAEAELMRADENLCGPDKNWYKPAMGKSLK